MIFKEGEANAVELGQKLDAMIEEMQQRPLFASMGHGAVFQSGADGAIFHF